MRAFKNLASAYFLWHRVAFDSTALLPSKKSVRASRMVRMGDGGPQIWYTIVEEMEAKLKNLELSGDDIVLDWKKLARKRRIDREIFEKYGYFKDIILHPKFQMAKQYLEDHANFDYTVGAPLMPWSTAVIILFMMHKRVNNTLLALAAAFLFSVNPFYVTLFVLLMWLLGGSKRIPKQFKQPSKSNSNKPSTSEQTLKQPASALAISPNKTYDYVLLGSDISTLYTAALLGRCGYSCCVLQPTNHTAVSIHPKGSPCVAPLQSSTVCKVERYQSLINAACPHSPSTPTPSFHPLGSEEDGYTSAIIKIHSKKDAARIGLGHLHTPARVFAVRAGEHAFLYDLASTFHLDKSVLAQAFMHIQTAAVGITSFLSKRIVSAADWSKGAMEKSQEYQAFHALVDSTVHQTMEKQGIDHPDLLDTLAHISSCIGSDPPASSASPPPTLALSLTLSALETSRFAIKGGVQALDKGLVQTVLRAGGVVIEGVDVGGLELEECSGAAEDGDAKFKAVGVSVSVHTQEVAITAERGVVSGLGVLCTHLALLPPQAVSPPTLQMLSSLTEAAPVVKCVFWLGARSGDLGVKGVEYFEVGGGEGKEESSGGGEGKGEGFVKIWSPSAMDPCWTDASVTVVVVELAVPAALVALQTHKPGDSEGAGVEAVQQDGAVSAGARLYMSLKDAETDVNHVDFAKCIGRKLVVSATKREDFLRRAEAHMYRIYPRCRGNIVASHVELPVLGGQRLANNLEKYTSNLGAATDVKNLFVTGVDIATSGLMGELQAGWITASAMLGYTLNDLNGNRNVVQDLLSM